MLSITKVTRWEYNSQDYPTENEALMAGILDHLNIPRAARTAVQERITNDPDTLINLLTRLKK